jgi:hypothetical protein
MKLPNWMSRALGIYGTSNKLLRRIAFTAAAALAPTVTILMADVIGPMATMCIVLGALLGMAAWIAAKD